MSDAYEEILEGEVCFRLPPEKRHEVIRERLHSRVAESLVSHTSAKLLSPRSLVELSFGNKVRPDLALVTAATSKLWLAAEVINSGDHNPDTVLKKTIYGQAGLPRLWMVDPRYNNVEVYHGSPHGLVLKQILALREVLSDPLLPGFQFAIEELFRA